MSAYIVAQKELIKMKFKFKINNRIIEVETDKDIQPCDYFDELPLLVDEKLHRNNETIESVFFEELLMICPECNNTLMGDEELNENICSRCKDEN